MYLYRQTYIHRLNDMSGHRSHFQGMFGNTGIVISASATVVCPHILWSTQLHWGHLFIDWPPCFLQIGNTLSST